MAVKISALGDGATTRLWLPIGNNREDGQKICVHSHTAAFLVGLMTRCMDGIGEALLPCKVRITLKRIKNGAAIDKA